MLESNRRPTLASAVCAGSATRFAPVALQARSGTLPTVRRVRQGLAARAQPQPLRRHRLRLRSRRGHDLGAASDFGAAARGFSDGSISRGGRRVCRDHAASGEDRFRDVHILDLGSGKGRALLLASMYPFAHIVGVEVQPELDDIARQNIERFTNPASNANSIESIAGTPGV